MEFVFRTNHHPTTYLVPKFGTNTDGRTRRRRNMATRHADEELSCDCFFRIFAIRGQQPSPSAARKLTFTSRYCSLDNFPSSFTPHEVGLENRLFDIVRAPFPITSFCFDTYLLDTTYLVKASLVYTVVRPFGNSLQRKLVNGRSYFPCWLQRKVLLNDLCKPI